MKARQDSLSLYVALFLFQYALLMPFMNFVPPNLIVGISGIGILLFLIYSENKKHLSLSVICLMLLHGLTLCVRVLLGDTPSLLIYGLLIPMPALAVFTFYGDLSHWLDYGIVLAILSFVLNCSTPFMGQFSYMRFGYGMILTTVTAITYSYARWNSLSVFEKGGIITLIVLSGLESLLYGPRGCIVVVSLCIFLLFAFSGSFGWKKMLLLLLGTISFFRISDIVGTLDSLVQKLGVRSYSIAKLKMQLDRGLEAASSGRDSIYATTFEQIMKNPMLGNHIESIGENGEYAHNLFLQVGLDWGLLGIVVLVFLLILVMRTVRNSTINPSERLLLIVITSMSLGRLMFSSTYWLRPEFWMMIGLTLWMRGKESNLADSYLRGSAIGS